MSPAVLTRETPWLTGPAGKPLAPGSAAPNDPAEVPLGGKKFEPL